MAADVVEVPPPQGRLVAGIVIARCSISSRSSPSSWRPSDPNTERRALHLRAAAGASISSTRAATWTSRRMSTASRPRSIRARSAATYRRRDPTRSSRSGSSSQATKYKMLGPVHLGRASARAARPAQPFYLLGADRLGRDNLSRIIHGARVSMSIGLVGVTISLVLGLDARRHLRLLRRPHRHRHPARHRVPALDADHPALDGRSPRRCRSTGRRSRSISSSPSSSR